MSTNLMQTTYIESLDLSNQNIPVILSNLSSKCEEQLSDHVMIRTGIYAKHVFPVPARTCSGERS